MKTSSKNDFLFDRTDGVRSEYANSTAFFLNSLSRTCIIYHKVRAGVEGDVENIEKSWSCCHYVMSYNHKRTVESGEKIQHLLQILFMADKMLQVGLLLCSGKGQD